MAEAAARPNPLKLIRTEIHEHSLQPYVAELDAQGYTVIPPKIAAPEGLADRLLHACLDVSERRTGVRPDLETGETHRNFKTAIY